MKKRIVVLAISIALGIFVLNAQIPIGGGGGFGGGTGSLSTTSGTFANLPLTCSIGATYKQTDGPYNYLCTNTNTWTAFLEGFGVVTVPPSTGWTSDNVSTGAFDSTNGSRYAASLPANVSAHGLRVQFATAPATPYAVTAGIRHIVNGMLPGAIGGEGGYGVVFGDGTGKYISLLVFLNAATGQNFFNATWATSTSAPTNLTVFSNNTFTTNFSELNQQPVQWFCLADDGTNLLFFWSLDRQHWKQFDSRLRTVFLASGPTRIGWGGDPFNNTEELTLVDWTINTAATCK